MLYPASINSCNNANKDSEASTSSTHNIIQTDIPCTKSTDMGDPHLDDISRIIKQVIFENVAHPSFQSDNERH